jgi:hypothetical protein
VSAALPRWDIFLLGDRLRTIRLSSDPRQTEKFLAGLKSKESAATFPPVCAMPGLPNKNPYLVCKLHFNIAWYKAQQSTAYNEEQSILYSTTTAQALERWLKRRGSL